MANNNQTYTTTVVINDAQAKKQVAELENTIKGYRKEMDKAYSSGDKALGDAYAKKIKAATKELNRLKLETMDVEKILNNLSDASMNQLQKAARSLNSQMKNLSVSSDEFKKKAEQLKEVNTALANARMESRAAESWTSRLADGFNKWQGAILGAVGAITGLTMTIRKATQDYADMEEEMANVRKYTGMTDEGIRDLNEDLKKMDTRTSRAELNQLAGDAGRLGIQGKEAIEEFVDAADKIHVALGDDLGENAVRDIGKLSQTFGDADDMGLRGAMLATGSAVNELAQSSSAAAGYIVDFTAKIAGAANQAGMAQTQVMGYASVLDQNMQKMEVASTALSQLITKMYQDPAKFARLASQDVEKFTELLRTDANQALLTFLESMRAKGGFDSLAPMFQEMGMSGARAIPVLSTLATNLDEIKRQQQIASEAFKEGTSVLDEFNIQNNTVQAGIDKAKKQFLEVSIALGQQLTPVVKYTITTGSAMVKGLSAFITILSRCRLTIIAATVALIAWNAAAIKALVIEKVTTAIKACRAAFIALSNAMKVNPWVLLATAIATVTAGIFEFISRSKEATKATDGLSDAQRRAQSNMERVKQKSEELVAKYKTLQAQWKSLSSEQEKVKWIKTNQEAFNELGLSIKSVNDANKVLIQDSAKVIQALTAVAEAAAYQELLEDSIKKRAEFERKSGGKVITKKAHAGDNIYDSNQYSQDELNAVLDYRREQIKKGKPVHLDNRTLSQDEAVVVQELRRNAARKAHNETLDGYKKEQEYLAGKMTEALNKVNSAQQNNIINNPTSDTGGSGGGTTEDPNKAKERALQESFDRQALIRKEALALDLQDENLSHEEKLQAEKDYEDDMSYMRQKLYSDMRDLYAKDSAEYNQWEDKRLSDQIAHDKKAVEEAQKSLEKQLEEQLRSRDKAQDEVRKLVDRYKGSSEEDELNAMDVRLKSEEEMIRSFHEQNLISEEEYQQALDAIQEAHAAVQTARRKKSLQDTADTVQFALSQVSSIVSGISANISASYQAQTAEVTARYDAEIKAAEKAGKDTTKIEERKQEELKKIQLEQIEAETQAQQAEALINIAMGVTKAIAEYVWPYNLIVAGITTAMGMVQLDTIQKNAEARKAAIGYYSGGFTGGNNYLREAGVVHEGEFVANHDTVNNPAVYPLLDLINQAQKNNTSGSLTEADISRQLGAAPAAAPVVNVTTDNSELRRSVDSMNEVVSRLSDQIDEGIETNISIQELEKKRKYYNKLIGA